MHRYLKCLFAILLSSLFSISVPALSQDASRFQPLHVAKMRLVTSVAVSPDGGHVAYTLSVPRRPLVDDDGPNWSELHVIRLGSGVRVDSDTPTETEPGDGAHESLGDSRPFITGEVSIGTPQWSPDGRSLYYTAKRTGDEQAVLYRIPVDGGESRRVLKHATSIDSFHLSPDGNQVAFLATPKTEASREELAKQGFNQQIYEEDWKLTRVWIADLNAGSDSMAAEGSTRMPRMLELPGSASAVRWSPSGKELMVVLAPTPSVDDSYMFQKVHVVDPQSGRIIRLVDHAAKLGQVAWSPDGKRLALVTGEDLHDPHEGRLMVVTVDGDEERIELLPELEAHVGKIAWKDESTLLWLAAEGVGSRFGTVTLDGRQETLISPGETVLEDFSAVGGEGPIALLGHAATHGPELFFAANVTVAPQRVTEVNPWLTKMRFAEQKVVRWTARDGLELEGVLIYPLNYVEGRRYPTIMYVHGGPEAHESNGWLTSYTRPGQVAAGRGFAVFYPNYRGSTGRSVEFSKLGQADAAGPEFDDLVDGIDSLIDLGITDRGKVGVTGASYGGYASAWCSTFYSDRFAASVMFVGISDNISKVGTTDIPEEMYLVHHRKRLWEDWDYFLQSSPIHYAERNRTPTLILHGKQDPRVHPSQSLELFRHLKTLAQAPVRLVLYEGEGHGNRKAAARLDYHLRLLQWMEHYLQGIGGDAPPMELDYQQGLGGESPAPRGAEG